VTTATAAPDATADGQADVAVPDACGLISSSELSELLGIETGEGSAQSGAPERSICIYPAGAITAIEIAGNYQASRDVIENEGRSTEDVPGVGNAAFFDEAGQLIVLGDRYFVAITAGAEIDVLVEVARRLLEGAGDDSAPTGTALRFSPASETRAQPVRSSRIDRRLARSFSFARRIAEAIIGPVNLENPEGWPRLRSVMRVALSPASVQV
jgi:hypothetical protein